MGIHLHRSRQGGSSVLEHRGLEPGQSMSILTEEDDRGSQKKIALVGNVATSLFVSGTRER